MLNLSPVERAEFFEEILTSFNFPERRNIDKKWANEVEDRIAAYDRGELKSKPTQDVFETINR